MFINEFEKVFFSPQENDMENIINRSKFPLTASQQLAKDDLRNMMSKTIPASTNSLF